MKRMVVLSVVVFGLLAGTAQAQTVPVSPGGFSNVLCGPGGDTVAPTQAITALKVTVRGESLLMVAHTNRRAHYQLGPQFVTVHDEGDRYVVKNLGSLPARVRFTC